MSAADRNRRVSIVTGGGGGIGAAIAMELGRRGDHVVTVDPLVSVDGTEVLPAPTETTAGRIVAAGGSAQASNTSVTDAGAMAALAAELMSTHRRIDAVVNVAGITRPTGFAKGEESDWSAVLSVHLDGYRNVLDAVLPHMAAAGRGHVVGVTSGSGWRAADAGAYSCAKRAVAALTWQLGRSAPDGVAINAISPIAMTRMVTAALGRSRPPAPGGGNPTAPRRSSATGGLSLGSMPEPEQLAPLGAALAGHGAARLRGQVLFAGGSEVAVVDPPRLLEVVRTSDVRSVDVVVAGLLDALVAAEAAQATSGGANPRFGALYGPTDEPDAGAPAAVDTSAAVAVVSDRPDLAAEVTAALDAHGSLTTVVTSSATAGFDDARAALGAAAISLGGLDAVVVALRCPTKAVGTDDWAAVLGDHAGLTELIHADAAWARAAAEHAAATERPLRLVTVTDAAGPGGRSRAQAAAQLARSSLGATGGAVGAYSVAVETDGHHDTTAALVGALASSPGAAGLSGAELVVGAGWFGLRSHPRPAGSIVVGGPGLPDWFDTILEEQCR
jgi:NAD(P)-dependent dehydrogenase (short-subunit alcohol dehydrogenase family)